MRIIFSRDRPAQLDLLLRSLASFAPEERTAVVFVASKQEFGMGYRQVVRESHAEFFGENGYKFNARLRQALRYADEHVTFFCDDDVVIRQTPPLPEINLTDPRILTHSLRLASPNGEFAWDWTVLPPTDHGYPGSIDGHTFRTEDVMTMIDRYVVPGPSKLETRLAEQSLKFAEKRPLMSASAEQKLVGVPVNRVSPVSTCPYGELHRQSTKELNRRFLNGQRIDLDAIVRQAHLVSGCHHEFMFEWTGP